MRVVPAWVDKVHERDKIDQCIYDLCFKPDGTQLVVAAGQRVLVYDTSDGSLHNPLKGHKDKVYCVSYARDGTRFASGSADKSVIIWTSKLEGILKYSHNEAIQRLAYNPISHQLASCGVSDFGMWTPEQKSVQKHKVSARINACSWTNDGQYLALGLGNGTVTVRSKNGEEKVKIERPGGSQSPVWALAWCPPSGSARDEAPDILCVTDWGQTMSFYTLGGKALGKERNLGFDPCCVSYFSKGEYLVVGGSNKCSVLYTKEGIRLGVIGEQTSWVWSCAAHPDANFVAVGCQDGTIAYHQIMFSTVHGLYKERYAYRENMTDVIIQHLLTDQKVRIKCRDLVKKIAIYKHRLAVQLPERIVIYELYSGDSADMHYRVKEKINQRLDCNLLVVCTKHLVLCQERRLQCLSLQGQKEREWYMDSLIRYIKVVGGASGQEGLLLGLKNGQVLKIFINNPFSVNILKISSAIRCLDLSCTRRKLAVVDEHNTCLVYDLDTRELLYQEPNANSVAWNTSCEDMLCFSGNNLLCIKANNFPVHQQKLLGFVVGFCGSKIFCLHVYSMSTIEVPLSTPMYQYLEAKKYRQAYDVACLGVTDSDWESLAHAALEGLEFSIAEKAFARIKKLPYVQLVCSLQEKKRYGQSSDEEILAEVYASQGKFADSARCFKKSGREDRALSMYTDLRMFDLAQEYLGSLGDVTDQKQLLKKRADWAAHINEPRAAAQMYLSAGETMKALEILAEHGWGDAIAEVGHNLEKSEREALEACAIHLKDLGMKSAAVEVQMKLGNLGQVAQLHVESQDWMEAFLLVNSHPQLAQDVYTPYAHWLAENDRFLEAQQAFHSAGCPQEAFHVLKQLTVNAVDEGRFCEAGYYYWLLSLQCLDLARNSAFSEREMVEQFHKNQKLADIYYAYHTIKRYTDEPFTSYMPEALFNIARYLLHEIVACQPPGVLKFNILYALSKQAKNLGAYKLARYALEKIYTMRIPKRFQENVDLATMSIRGKPFHDNTDLLPMCYRCSTTNPLHSGLPNICVNCHQGLVYSFVSFEGLPMVEFHLDEGITDKEAEDLIFASPPRRSQEEEMEVAYQQLRLDGDPLYSSPYSPPDPFSARLNSFEVGGVEAGSVVVGRDYLPYLEANEVVICRWPAPLRWQYYRNIMPEVPVTQCDYCNRMFHADDYELQVLQQGHCPFCRTLSESESG